MMQNEINIVSFDVPYPPNYGGVVDVFFKLKAFSELGVKIHLHCFEYGRGRQDELNKYCTSVTYYKRDQRKTKLLDKLPFVVSSRKNKILLQNLRSNSFPILIEGLHDAWYLEQLQSDNRKIIVRTHNVEHDYYIGLAKVEKSFFKKQFFKAEARKLKQFEKVLNNADRLLSISPNDTKYFNDQYKNASYIPAFHSGSKVSSKLGKGTFALYHGNLGVGENQQAAMFLIEEVFSKVKYPLIIAGNAPSLELKKAVDKYDNIEIRATLTFTEMDALISDAHINILPTFQPTGIKLKMLSALYKGRFCLVNDFMVKNTGLEELCVRANTADQFREEIERLAKVSFESEHLEQREKILSEQFDNLSNAKNVMAFFES